MSHVEADLAFHCGFLDCLYHVGGLRRGESDGLFEEDVNSLSGGRLNLSLVGERWNAEVDRVELRRLEHGGEALETLRDLVLGSKRGGGARNCVGYRYDLGFVELF